LVGQASQAPIVHWSVQSLVLGQVLASSGGTRPLTQFSCTPAGLGAQSCGADAPVSLPPKAVASQAAEGVQSPVDAMHAAWSAASIEQAAVEPTLSQEQAPAFGVMYCRATPPRRSAPQPVAAPAHSKAPGRGGYRTDLGGARGGHLACDARGRRALALLLVDVGVARAARGDGLRGLLHPEAVHLRGGGRARSAAAARAAAARDPRRAPSASTG
jgi:hypothetical protein